MFDQAEDLLNQMKNVLKEDKVDGVICVAGGWMGGNAAHNDFIKSCDLMWKQSVWSSAIAANIATQYLKPGGFVSLTGADAATDQTPGSSRIVFTNIFPSSNMIYYSFRHDWIRNGKSGYPSIDQIFSW